MLRLMGSTGTHGHGHGTAAGAYRGRLAIVLAVSVTNVAVLATGGLITGSLALLADAGHMLADASGVGLSLLAVLLAARPATQERTFGYQRVEIFAAVVNAVVLFGVGAYFLVESVRRLLDPPEVASGGMLVFAVAAIVGNAVSMTFLFRGQRESLNLRGAFLEVLSDMLGSAGVVVASLVITFTGFHRADAVASGLIGLMILPRTWRLLRDAVDVLLEATPKHVDLAEVRSHLLGAPGVQDVHDLHAWTITSGVPVLSAHIVVAESALADGAGGRILDQLGGCLEGHFDVEHCTFQLEPHGHADHEPTLHA